jgi:hypothetical protein
MSRAQVVIVLIVGVFCGSTRGQSPTRVGGPQTGATAIERIRIGVDANPKATSKYERRDRHEAIRLMRTTGANHFHYAKVWVDIEREPGTFDLDDVRFMMEESWPLSVAFNLRVVDAGSRNMPEAYKNLAWDSPQMIEHLTRVIEELAPVLGRRPWSYAVGNEIDAYFQSRPGEIAAYGRMLQQVKPRLRALHPRARITASFQFAAVSQVRTLYAPIVAALDHVSFNYYPLRADFSVRPEDSVFSDLTAMIVAAQPRPIFLQEIGYPTATLLGSSPEKQRAFVKNTFDAIRGAGSARVFGATYLFQADLPDFIVADVVRAYGLNAEPFRAYLMTLGLRDERDRPKPAWDEFVRQAHIIGPNH